MRKLKVIFGLYFVLVAISLTSAARAVDESGSEQRKRKPCPEGQECMAQSKEHREERRKKILEEKCHGDSACEAQMKQKFEEKRAKIQQAMNQCTQGDEACRKEVRQKMIREFKEKRLANQKNRNVK